MKQNEIIEMARHVGMSLDICHDVLLVRYIPKDGIKAFAKLVAAKERDACAKLCESLFDSDDDSCDEAEKCAAAIRARGQQ